MSSKTGYGIDDKLGTLKHGELRDKIGRATEGILRPIRSDFDKRASAALSERPARRVDTYQIKMDALKSALKLAQDALEKIELEELEQAPSASEELGRVPPASSAYDPFDLGFTSKDVNNTPFNKRPEFERRVADKMNPKPFEKATRNFPGGAKTRKKPNQAAKKPAAKKPAAKKPAKKPAKKKP